MTNMELEAQGILDGGEGMEIGRVEIWSRVDKEEEEEEGEEAELGGATG